MQKVWDQKTLQMRLLVNTCHETFSTRAKQRKKHPQKLMCSFKKTIAQAKTKKISPPHPPPPRPPPPKKKKIHMKSLNFHPKNSRLRLLLATSDSKAASCLGPGPDISPWILGCGSVDRRNARFSWPFS